MKLLKVKELKIIRDLIGKSVLIYLLGVYFGYEIILKIFKINIIFENSNIGKIL